MNTVWEDLRAAGQVLTIAGVLLAAWGGSLLILGDEPTYIVGAGLTGTGMLLVFGAAGLSMGVVALAMAWLGEHDT